MRLVGGWLLVRSYQSEFLLIDRSSTRVIRDDRGQFRYLVVLIDRIYCELSASPIMFRGNVCVLADLEQCQSWPDCTAVAARSVEVYILTPISGPGFPLRLVNYPNT